MNFANFRIVLLIAVLMSVTFVGGCANSTASPCAAGQPHAKCLVCEHNADLACVDVVVNEKTPHTEVGGQTYYFCSEDCKHDFEKHSSKFAAAAR